MYRDKKDEDILNLLKKKLPPKTLQKLYRYFRENFCNTFNFEILKEVPKEYKKYNFNEEGSLFKQEWCKSSQKNCDDDSFSGAMIVPIRFRFQIKKKFLKFCFID